MLANLELPAIVSSFSVTAVRGICVLSPPIPTCTTVPVGRVLCYNEKKIIEKVLRSLANAFMFDLCSSSIISDIVFFILVSVKV